VNCYSVSNMVFLSLFFVFYFQKLSLSIFFYIELTENFFSLKQCEIAAVFSHMIFL